jgi:Mn2+/Fe2+ NRAMP family transporter
MDLVLTYPLMVGIQMVSARIGRVTGHGLAANIRRQFPRPVLYVIVSMLVIANTINVAADIAAMGEALQLVIGGPEHGHALLFGVVCLGLQIFMPFARYVRYLKWLTLSLLAYVAVCVRDRRAVARARARPLVAEHPIDRAGADRHRRRVRHDDQPLPLLLAGRTGGGRAECRRHRQSACACARGRAEHLHRIKIDTYAGMGFSNLIALFILISTAATLHRAGITDIETSAQAAEALRPIAGDFAFLLFSLGIIGTGLLAVPVLSGSAAYAMAETFNWKSGLDLKLLEAREFYAIIVLATLVGVALDFTPIDPIKALFWSAVINGVIAVPIMVVMMLMADDPDVMGRFTVTRRLKALGWLATWTMAAAVVAMLVAS